MHDKPLLGPKPDELVIFKMPQVAIKLHDLLQPTTLAADTHSNLSVVDQAIAPMYEHPALHDHVPGWTLMRSGQHNAVSETPLHSTATGSIQFVLHRAAAPVSLPVSTVACKQLPDVAMVCMHNVPEGVDVHGLMDCLLPHFQFGLEYTVVAEHGVDAFDDIAVAIPTWCRSEMCIAELRALVSDARLARLPFHVQGGQFL